MMAATSGGVYNAMTAARKKATELERSGKWVEMRIGPDGTIRLDYGAILSDGTQEQAIATLTFDANGGYTKAVHP
jgi:hypothetical protein